SSENKIITSVEIKLNKGEKDKIDAEMRDYLGRRKDKQPLEYPSAGSVFKRPEGYFAGALVEQSGLKGKRIGGAMVSEKHAGFIINYDNATTTDVLELIDFCRETVKEKFGVTLEAEIKTV
ncbi:MAG: UDP-N-acetylenolpyruvoylglucosamine reductase, partial [Clostridia bacterium]|nr:UDP-N-acetylenolpyruvoylglucosamine reductase [Clostridia bacterium]